MEIHRTVIYDVQQLRPFGRLYVRFFSQHLNGSQNPIEWGCGLVAEQREDIGFEGIEFFE